MASPENVAAAACAQLLNIQQGEGMTVTPSKVTFEHEHLKATAYWVGDIIRIDIKGVRRG